MKRFVSRFVPLLILCSLLVTLPKINTTEAEPKTIVVPDDYPTIQEAIDNADEGDTVFVKTGAYYNQTLIINKSLSLIGEDSKTTVLIGTVVTYVSFVTVIQINANDVKISGFTIMNTWYCIAGNGDRTQIIGNILTTTYDYGFDTGIAVHGSYKTIAENIITGGVVGIQGSGSCNNITGNTITGTGDRSIELYGSFNIVTGNNIRGHVGTGIQIYSGDSNTITKNNITDGRNGIHIHNGSRNTVSENRVTGMAGSGISIMRGFDNTIYGNYIANNKWGAIIGGYECKAGNNTVYHNNFIDNTVQVRTDWTVYGVNHWDNGYPSGGNYWSDYGDRYPNATELDASGIWDTPYVIDENNQDNYPLMHPLVAPPPLDTTPPAISIISPENKTYVVNNVSLTFTASEPTFWMRYSLDGEANVTVAGNTTLTGLSDGIHSLTVYASDLFGNIGSSSKVYFTIDAPPSISILSPENKTYETTDIPLAFTVDETVSWMAYSLDDQANVTIITNTTLNGLSDGSHSITVYASDTAGNTGASDKVYFTIDTILPSISILSPENKTYETTDIPLTFTVDETTSWMGYSLDGQANITITGNSTLTGLSEGSHSLVVYARDVAGNTGTSETIYFSIKTQKTEPFPTWIIVAIVTIAVIAATLLVYFRKIRKHRKA